MNDELRIEQSELRSWIIDCVLLIVNCPLSIVHCT